MKRLGVLPNLSRLSPASRSLSATIILHNLHGQRHASQVPGAFKWFRRSTVPDEKRQTSWQETIAQQEATNDSEQVDYRSKDKTLRRKLQYLDDKAIMTILSTVCFPGNARNGSVAGLFLELGGLHASDETTRSEAEFVFRDVVETLIGLDRDAVLWAFVRDLTQGWEENLALEVWEVILEMYMKRSDLKKLLRARLYMDEHGMGENLKILKYELDLLSRRKEFWHDARALYELLPSLGFEPDAGCRYLMLHSCMWHPTTGSERAERLRYGSSVYEQIVKLDLGTAHKIEFLSFQGYFGWHVYRGDSIEKIVASVKDAQSRFGHELSFDDVEFMYMSAVSGHRPQFVQDIISAFENRVSLAPSSYSWRILAAEMADDYEMSKVARNLAKADGLESALNEKALLSLVRMEFRNVKEPNDEYIQSCLYFLSRLETVPYNKEILQLLVPHLIRYNHFASLESILSRAKARDDFDAARVIDLIIAQLPQAKDTKLVWNVFTLLKNLFWDDPVYDRQSRFAILARAIDLDEPRVVGQLFSQFLKSKIQPDEKFYIDTLQGARKLRDFDLIRRIHQFLQMDINVIEPSAILNTLMNAYAYVNSSLTFDIWEQIYKSGKGPTNASVSIVLDGCTYANMHSKGQLIWSMLERQGFVFNDNNYASYVEMLNKCTDTYEAIEVLNNALSTGKDVSVRAISTLYNTGTRKKEVAAWAESTCPEIWAKVKKSHLH